MLPEGGQAVFDMPDLQPAPVAPPAPKIYFDSPSSSGDDVLVKFEIADYDLARDGPASIVLDSRLKALVAESPCTLVRSQPAPLSHSAPISYRGGTWSAPSLASAQFRWQVLQDLAAGQHEVIVELPMRQIDGSVRFHVVRPERAEHSTWARVAPQYRLSRGRTVPAACLGASI
jgi:hypothetical protein